jgi:hypothetical protein
MQMTQVLHKLKHFEELYHEEKQTSKLLKSKLSSLQTPPQQVTVNIKNYSCFNFTSATTQHEVKLSNHDLKKDFNLNTDIHTENDN